MNYRQIVWIASYPKSGNTWFRLFLDAYFLGEVDINDMVVTVGDDRVDRAQVGDGSEPWRFPVDIQQLIRPMSLLRLVRAFSENRFADVPLFVKTHATNLPINGIELISEPLTKSTIFIVRDPRDVLPSLAKHMGKTLDEALEMMSDQYQMLKPDETKMSDFISSWYLHTKSFLNDTDHKVLLIRYEEMKDNPVDTFSRMLKHAGVDPVEEKVKAALELVDIEKLRDQESKNGFGEASPHADGKFFGPGKVGGWRGKLTPKQLHTIEKRFGGLMKRLGYLEKRRAA